MIGDCMMLANRVYPKLKKSSKAAAKRITQDAGQELIGYTFVAFNKMNFVSNELVAKITLEVAKQSASKLPGLAQTAAITAAEKVYKKTKDGYSVWTTTYLYRIKYDEAKINEFFSTYWSAKPDPAKKTLFEQADNLLDLKFVGKAKATTLVLFTGDKTKERIIQVATKRNFGSGNCEAATQVRCL